MTFEGEETDAISIEAMNKVKEKLSGYDTYISSAVGAGQAELIQNEMNTVMVIVYLFTDCSNYYLSRTFIYKSNLYGSTCFNYYLWCSSYFK